MTITWGIIAGVCGGIIVLWQAFKVLFEIVSPAINLKETVDKHDSDIQEIKEYMRRLDDTMKQNNHMNTMQLRCMTDIVNHMIDGNHVDNMKSTRDDILNLLSKKYS